MSTVNFFDKKYKREDFRTDICFGIIDDGKMAHTVVDISSDEYDVSVCNPYHKECLFTPVDHNIVVKENGNEKPQCDGMLTTSDNAYLIFVEIKSQQHGADVEAQKQLRSTIAIFSESHNPMLWKNRRAYIVNKVHPHFNYSNKQMYQDFHNQTKFFLKKENKISIF